MKNKIPQIGTNEFNDLASACFGGKPKQETLEEVWEQTMHLRFFLKRKNGCKSENVLQQLFISNLGNKEWTDVPSLKY